MTASRLTFLAAAALALAAAAPAWSQQVYRIVGPDGKVTFSDRAPDPAAGSQVSGAQAGGGGGAGSGELPYALRQVATRYPVTLYTGTDCSPCANARVLLQQRGVPFAERTVNTGEDIDALKRLAGEASLPFATIGAQQLKGYSEAEWAQYLDAAGYPRQSQLPASYRRPPATPLAAPAAKPAAAPASSPREAAAPRPAGAQPPQRNPANPAGIIF